MTTGLESLPTDKQMDDYRRVLEVQEMTLEHFLELNIVLYSWDHGDRLRYHLQYREGQLYRATHLERYDASSWNAGRCYTKGTEKWRRQDGAPLTAADEQAIKLISRGQGNCFTGTTGDQFIQLDWACDSSD